MIYVDTNILIDLLDPGDVWTKWSRAMLGSLAARDRLVTGPIVLAEIARYAADAESLARIPGLFGVEVMAWSTDASFRAGRAFQAHVARTGMRGAILADFLIGGHAGALGAAVLTRDPRLLRSGFPDLPLVTPDTHP